MSKAVGITEALKCTEDTEHRVSVPSGPTVASVVPHPPQKKSHRRHCIPLVASVHSAARWLRHLVFLLIVYYPPSTLWLSLDSMMLQCYKATAWLCLDSKLTTRFSDITKPHWWSCYKSSSLLFKLLSSSSKSSMSGDKRNAGRKDRNLADDP